MTTCTLAALSDTEADVLIGHLRDEIDAQVALEAALAESNRALASNDLGVLAERTESTATLLERIDTLSRRRARVLAPLFRRAGVEAGRDALGAVVMAMPSDRRDEVAAVREELRRVAASVRRWNARNQMFIREMSVVNRQLLMALVGGNDESAFEEGEATGRVSSGRLDRSA